MQEDTQKTQESTSQSGAVIYHDDSPQKKRRWPIFAAISIGVIIIGVTAMILLQKPKQEAPKINADRSITYTYEESSSAEAYGNLLSAALESYKVGGNKNGIKVEGRGHYPTDEQVKNKEWSRANLKLNDDVVNLIEEGTLSYTASGCEQEKCTAYVIKADDKEVTKNLN